MARVEPYASWAIEISPCAEALVYDPGQRRQMAPPARPAVAVAEVETRHSCAHLGLGSYIKVPGTSGCVMRDVFGYNTGKSKR